MVITSLLCSKGFAKDILIPENKDRTTIYNYEDWRYKYKKALKKKHRLNKEVYSFPDYADDFALTEYLNSLDEDPLNLDHIQSKPLEPKKPVIAETNLSRKLPKNLEPQAKVVYAQFNSASLNLQSQLSCPVTPKLKTTAIQNKPDEFLLSNNLRRKTKTPRLASGDIIYVTGQIHDVNCTPVAGAKINLWHNDAYGTNEDKYFMQTGTATTDNLGNFGFITILPGYDTAQTSLPKIAPHINIAVSHNEFAKTVTRMYFPSNSYNYLDDTFLELDPFSRQLVTSELIPVNLNNLDEGYMMVFDVTLDGVSKFRTL